MIEKMLEPLIPERFKTDEKYRMGHLHVIHPLPGVKILGVHIPEMKKFATEIVKRGEALDLIEQMEKRQAEDSRSGLLYEEKQIWGMMLNRVKVPLEQRLQMIRRFVPAIDNWAVCDTFCCDAKWVGKCKVDIWCFIQEYFYSRREFDVRFAMVMSLAHYLEGEYLEKIFRIIKDLKYERISTDYAEMKTRPYYVYMAAGWLMATALYKLPEMTRTFANSGSCPDEILRMYVRKAKESFRTRYTSPL